MPYQKKNKKIIYPIEITPLLFTYKINLETQNLAKFANLPILVS